MRVSAKELTSLILDEERLRSERSDRKTWKSRVTGIEEYSSQSHNSSGDGPSSSRRQRPQRAQRADEEDAEYKLAIEASKYQEEEDRKKRQSRGGAAEPEDDDLAKAIKLSKEEEELRKRELEESNAASLFDDTPVQTQPTGFNQGYQQQGAVDWSGNPIDSQQQGYLATGYTGYGNQPQQTGSYPNGYQNGFQQQPTGFDPYGSMQQQQQPSYQQPQTTGYNPYMQQQPTASPFQQQQTATPEPLVAANTNNPWANNNSQQSLQPTPTGSNNPFAPSFGRPQATSTPSKPTLATLQEQQTATNFNNNSPYNTSFNQKTQSSFNPITSFTPPPKQEDPHAARLNALLATGEGQDTFGNTGSTRIPAQHTAPGQFVNSAGNVSNRMAPQQTGTNPFLHNQYTGMPQTSYNNTGSPFGGQQMPAATGPAGMGGFGGQGSSNPFGPRPGQPQQKNQGDLIQF